MKKLKWETDKKAKDSLFEEHSSLNFVISMVHSRTKNGYRYLYQLENEGDFIGRFKKLLRAKKVAQLIYNG